MMSVTTGQLRARFGVDPAYLHRWRQRGLIHTEGHRAPKWGGHHGVDGPNATRWPAWVARLVPLLLADQHYRSGHDPSSTRALWRAIAGVLDRHPAAPVVLVDDAGAVPVETVEAGARWHLSRSRHRAHGTIVCTTIVVPLPPEPES